jgi:hypothetical protein
MRGGIMIESGSYRVRYFGALVSRLLGGPGDVLRYAGLEATVPEL